MALFKILKGDSSRISTDVTPFHDGYAYFTPDDGGFYIDSEDNGEQKRHRINPVNSSGSTAVSATLLSGGWSSGEQTLQISGVTAESNGVIGLSQSVSDAEMEAAKKCRTLCVRARNRNYHNCSLWRNAYTRYSRCCYPAWLIWRCM